MLSKILNLRRVSASIVNRRNPAGKLLNSVFQTSGNPVNNGAKVLITPARSCAYRCDAHMNELPVPCAPWEPWYSDKQSSYNKILLGGILWFLFSFGMMIFTDSIFLNWGPPKNPGPPSDMVEECEDD